MTIRPVTPLLTLLTLSVAWRSSAPLAAADQPSLPTLAPTDSELAGMAAAAATQGWINLLRDPELSEWQRAPLPPEAPLDARNPWALDPATGILLCGGTGVHEMLLHRTERGDGIFHVEWRFAGNPDRPSGGVLARTKPDNSAWHVAKLAPSGIGMLLGVSPDSRGRARRFSNGKRRPDLLKKEGEWNVIELVCIGTRVRLHFNGVVTADWNDCEIRAGLFGLEADGTPVEFRGVRFRPL